jgi:hypothetical protein
MFLLLSSFIVTFVGIPISLVEMDEMLIGLLFVLSLTIMIGPNRSSNGKDLFYKTITFQIGISRLCLMSSII